MSAYLVDEHHVCYLVAAALALTTARRDSVYRWWYGNPGRSPVLSVGASDAEKAAVASMLWAENLRSVRARYPSEKAYADGRESVYVVPPSKVARMVWADFPLPCVIKACDCFDYQICETDDWRESQAFAFVSQLRLLAVRSMPGYDVAPWGAPEPRAGVLAVMS